MRLDGESREDAEESSQVVTLSRRCGARTARGGRRLRPPAGMKEEPHNVRSPVTLFAFTLTSTV